MSGLGVDGAGKLTSIICGLNRTDLTAIYRQFLVEEDSATDDSAMRGVRGVERCTAFLLSLQVD